MFDYIEQRVTLAQTQRQLQADPSLSKRVDLVVPIVSSFFEAVPDNQQLEGRNYTLKRFGNIRSVVAKDGRGEVLRLRGRWVEKASLEDKDVQLWQQAQENRIKQSQQQLSPLPKPLKPKSKSKPKKQIELD
jgi:predicted transposase YdaD